MVIYCRILSDRIPICPSGYTITVMYDGYSIFANNLTLFA
nr:MAG TPA: type 4 procollagen tandem repeat domain containing protein [Caudoviricetes sp.]